MSRRPAVGTLIAARLDAIPMTVTDQAAALGLHRSRIHRYRTGREEWPARHYARLAELLGVDVAQLADLARRDDKGRCIQGPRH